MYEFFDKRIDLSFYGEDGTLLGILATPETGAKPEITVRGTLITEDTALSLEVIVTNLERDFPINMVSWVKATMYYGRTLAEDSSKSLIMNVLYADQSKGPPNRQVMFKCVVASSCPKLFNQVIEFNYSSKGESITKPLKSVLTDFTAKCKELQNQWDIIKNSQSDLKADLTLANEPVYLGFKSSDEEKQVLIGYWKGTVYQFLSYISSQFHDIEKIVDKDTNEKRYYPALHIFFSGNKLYVQKNPSVDNSFVDNENAEIKLDHVLGAYRQGPIVYLKTLFDPRIDQTTTIMISAFNIGGTKSLGKLVPMNKESKENMIKFTPIGGIKFEFGTVNGNSMSMQGVFEEVTNGYNATS